MPIPKVEFKYSWVYDEIYRQWIKAYKKDIKYYPPKEEVLAYMDTVEKLWRKEERKIFKEITKVTGLQWSSKKIICYVVGNCVPFSEPLTIPMYDEPSLFIDTLTHELIHRLFTENKNYQKSKKAWAYIHRKYKNESIHTRIHIPVHAIHAHIYITFYGDENMQRDIALVSDLEDYRRSWDIVCDAGYVQILTAFTNRI